MQLKAGGRLKSSVCETQVVVVKAPDTEVDLRCGGAPMVPLDAEPAEGSLDESFAGGTLLGKRYADDAVGIELLCTKAGKGTLALGSEPIGIKQAKALPSSD